MTTSDMEEGTVDIVFIDASPMAIQFREAWLQFTELWEEAPQFVAQREAELFEDEGVLAAMEAGDPDIGAAFNNVELAVAALENALTLRARAGQARADLAWTLLGVVGRVLANVEKRRRAVKLGEEGLAMFDNDLEGLAWRYREVYRRFFEQVQVDEGVERDATAPSPDASEWDAERFDELERYVVGPILLWDVAQCEELWPEPEVPRCGGPDLLTAWSLSNQIDAGASNQRLLLRSVFGFLSYKLDEFATQLGEDLGIIFDRLAEAAKEVWDRVKTAVAKAFPTKWVVGGLIILGGVLFLKGRKK